MTSRKKDVLPESVKQAVAEIGKSVDNVGSDASTPAPDVVKPSIRQAVSEKPSWGETARRLKLIPKMPQTFSEDQKWKTVAKEAGKTALKSIGASLGYMVIMSAMAAGFALALRSNDSKVFIETLGSHDS